MGYPKPFCLWSGVESNGVSSLFVCDLGYKGMVWAPFPARSGTSRPSPPKAIQEHFFHSTIALNHCFKNWNMRMTFMSACSLSAISKWACAEFRWRPILFLYHSLIWSLACLLHKTEKPQHQLYENLSPKHKISPSPTAVSFLQCRKEKLNTSGG